MKQLMQGNVAIAQGAWEAGVAVSSGYPGTPSTEVLEALAKKEGVYCEWAPNEKVALEVALGASLGGVRSMATMKHVGVNVAADPFMSAANTGVGAGLVLVAADDPSCYSSQNEQDSRTYAAFARIPCLDPSDSQEAYEFTRAAFDVSERFDTLVMLHETMRIAHTKTMVSVHNDRKALEPMPYESHPNKFVMMPANAVKRTLNTNEREDALIAWAETSELNRVEHRSAQIGIICAGALYQHVREAAPEASVLKLGITWPLPPKLLRSFAASVDRLYVIEEACDYLSLRVRAAGIALADFPGTSLPRSGEITPAHIRAALALPDVSHDVPIEGLPPRPPALCAGCPHRLVYVELRRRNAIVTGDIGCYTLGAIAPFNAVDSVIDMGASVSMGHGMELAGVANRAKRPVVAVIGDSTFAHSGITSLLGTVYNGGKGTVCILDNRTTAMTGTQGNPVNGVTLAQQVAASSRGARAALDQPAGKALDLPALCRAIGVDEVIEADAQDVEAVREALGTALTHDDLLSVVIFKSPCRLVDRTRQSVPTIEDCRRCGVCIRIGCPALGRDEDGGANIDPAQCIGCDQCIQSCPFGCITRTTSDADDASACVSSAKEN